MTPHPYSDKKINKINNKIFQHCRSEPLNLGHTLVQDPTYAHRFNPFTWELNVPIHIVCQKAPHRAFNLHIGFPKPYIKLRDACIAAKWLPLCQQWDICFYLFIVLYDSIWWGNSEWIGIHILCETICFPPWCIEGVGGGNGQIHPFFHKCFHFKTSWGSRRRVLCSSILRQAACCYLINTGAWIHQWITSRVSRPSAASAQHIFWRAVPL